MFEPHGEIVPEDVSEEDTERILKRLASEIVSRRLTAPAIFLLESCSPLSFVGSQALIVLEPFVHAIFDLPDYRRFALIMERRENVRRFIEMIEIANQEQRLTEKGRRKKRSWGFLRRKRRGENGKTRAEGRRENGKEGESEEARKRVRKGGC